MCEDSHHDQGLAYDIQALLARRRFLKGLAASSAGLAVAGCDLLPWPGRAEAEVTGKAADGSVCIVDPAETAGPFPADGSNRAHGTLANVLSETGIVRRDMRPSIGLEPATVADGAEIDLEILLLDVRTGCKPLSGHAIYLWHCDAAGRYSIYEREDANYLRAVGVTDDSGRVSFKTIVPGCYLGRAPHMHFEVYPTLESTADYNNRVLTSQLAVPRATCQEVYAKGAAYELSNKNFARTPPVEEDGIFADNTPAQLKAQTLSISGSAQSGFTAKVTIGI